MLLTKFVRQKKKKKKPLKIVKTNTTHIGVELFILETLREELCEHNLQNTWNICEEVVVLSAPGRTKGEKEVR
jgi:hypothetical protein